ncbi:MAG: hypothetical protein IT457_11115 [Planctomycetes bacterium]|nr:hypothetical protein [Planctomycetota bacterium]
MKLALVLADAARPDALGTLSALGLGITRLTVARTPGQFRGSLVMVATPDEGEPLEHEFSMTVAVPGQEAQQFAVGGFTSGGPRQQVVMAHSFEMIISTLGTYVFRIDAGDSYAETRLLVEEAAGMPANGTASAQESSR